MRILPTKVLPRDYPFLTRHSARSFITYYTYDHTSAPFVRTLTVPHGMANVPLHDMWIAKTRDVSGSATVDFPTTISEIYHGPLAFFLGNNGGSLRDSYTCYTDKENVYIQVNHVAATTESYSYNGTYHVYFHVKLYVDDFKADFKDGERSDAP